MKKMILWMSLFLFIPNTWAIEIEGVQVPDQVMIEGKPLQLHGAGVRTKFFFDIYIGALYLSYPASNSADVLAKPNPARVTMDILYGELAKEKLTKGWTAGFKKNQSRADYMALKERLEAFNKMFHDAHKGDHFTFDFLSDKTTKVIINGREIGSITGLDFQKALLLVWLGEKPADKDLKRAMLGEH